VTIKALLFDFDGLILDTEYPIFSAWAEIFKENQCELTLETYASYLGLDALAFDPVVLIHQQTGQRLLRSDLDKRMEEILKVTLYNEKPLPGVMDYLEVGRQMGLKLAVASSGDRWWVGGHLDRLNLTHHFDFVCTFDEVPRAKPFPDLFQCAMKNLGVEPQESIVLEDSRNGLLAGKAAGCYCVAVPNKISEFLDLSPADLIIPSMSAVPLPELIKQIQTL